ncbi:MAG: hypothetical protein HYR81_04195 [Nitrospirae bacterium]|nr:hypothetical protein [Nitrospirota bacterium]
MTPAEIHQVEGFDPRKRSFNRNFSVYKKDRSYFIQFTYEESHVETPPFQTPAEAVKALAKTLEDKNFTLLRTRINFKGEKYLTELEPWINHS